jgi:O-antigen/teichoic acid export membrane protein
MLPLSDDGSAARLARETDGKLRPLQAATLVKIGVYFGNFGLSKAAAYLAPLLVAARLDSSTYGVIEYAWSWSALLATLLTLGIPGAVPQLSLLRRPVPVIDIMALCIAAPGAVLATAALLTLSFVDTPARAVVLAVGAIALPQVVLSSYARTFSRRNLASWVEGLSIYTIAAIAICLGFAGLARVELLGVATSIVSAILVVVALILLARLKQTEFFARLRSAIWLGLPLLAFTLASIWASVCGRIYIGAFLSIEDLSIYSVDFRIGSALLIIHSIVATGLFARLYRMRSRLYDRFLSTYLVAIAIIGVVMIALFPAFVSHIRFRSLGTNNIPAAIALFPIVLLQVYAWGAWASLEMRLARMRRSAAAARRAMLLMAATAALCVGFGTHGILTLRLCAILVALQSLGGVAIQLFTLWRRGARMPRSAAAITFGTVLISAIGWIIQPQ